MPYENQIGIFYPASWVNGFLLAIEVKEAIHYFSTYRQERASNRIGVLVALLSDFVCVISIMILSWLYVIKHFGDREYTENAIPWPVPAYCITTSIATLMCQLALLGRLRTLSEAWFMSAVIAPVVTGAFVMGAICTHALATKASNEHKLSTIWAGVRAGADILTAAAIIIYQQTARTTIASSDSMIKRIWLTLMSTGFISSVLSLLTLVLFVTRPPPDGHLGTMFSMVLGRVASLTMIMNLNTRLENRTLSPDDPEHHRSRTDAFGLKPRNGGVRVDRSVVVQADREEHSFAVRPDVLYSHTGSGGGGVASDTYDHHHGDDGENDYVSFDSRKQESQVDLVK